MEICFNAILNINTLELMFKIHVLVRPLTLTDQYKRRFRKSVYKARLQNLWCVLKGVTESSGQIQVY